VIPAAFSERVSRAGTIAAKESMALQRSARGDTRADLTKDAVLESLKEVYDPEIGINIVDLGLVYDVGFHDNSDVEVTMTLTSMGCPLGPVIISDVQKAVGTLDPGGDVHVRIVWSPPWSPALMSEDARDELGIW
jgi:metal-sulfur cluster biosynthetic enzyme